MSRKRVLAAGAAVFLIASLCVAMAAPALAQSWSYYKSITIDHTKVDGNLADYPLTFVVTDSDIATTANGGHVENTASGGASGNVTVPADLVFGADSSCSTQYDHEIESYEPVSGALVAHIRVPNVYSDTDTTLYMCYSDDNITTSQEAVAATWEDDFEAVYHLGEEGGTTVYDSTTNDNTGYIHGDITLGQSGKIGNGYRIQDTGTTYVEVPDVLALRTLTILFWTRHESPSDGTRDNDVRFREEDLNFAMRDEGDGNYTVRNHDGGDWKVITTTVIADTWTHFAGILDDSDDTMELIKDGSSVDSVSNGYTSYETNGCGIGGSYSGSYSLQGYLDEIWICSTARLVNWISTIYNNQSDPSSFYTVGSEQELATPTPTPTGSATPYPYATATPYNVGDSTLPETDLGDPLMTAGESEQPTDPSAWGWKRKVDQFLAPVFGRLIDAHGRLQEARTRACGTVGDTFTPYEALAIPNPGENPTMQEMALTFGQSLGQPIAYVRALQQSSQSTSFIDLLVYFSLGGTAWVSFITGLAILIRIVRALIDVAIEVYNLIPFIG